MSSLLDRLVVMYGKPETGDVPAYFAELSKMLVKYTDDELDRAGNAIVRTHRGRAFPTPSEIVTACEDVRAASAPARLPANSFEEKYPDWSKQAFAIADRMVAGELGKRAAKEGWILGLHEFCRKHRRMPSSFEVRMIQQDSEFVTRCAAGAVDMGYFHGPLQKLATAMVDRREKLAEKVLGKAAPTETSRRMTGDGE
jgi:hypothetical protein